MLDHGSSNVLSWTWTTSPPNPQQRQLPLVHGFHRSMVQQLYPALMVLYQRSVIHAYCLFHRLEPLHFLPLLPRTSLELLMLLPTLGGQQRRLELRPLMLCLRMPTNSLARQCTDFLVHEVKCQSLASPHTSGTISSARIPMPLPARPRTCTHPRLGHTSPRSLEILPMRLLP